MLKQIDVDISEIEPQLKKLRAMPNHFVRDVLIRAVAQIKPDTPAATGQMTNATRHEMLDKNSGQILVDTNYASFAHDGRKPGKVEGWAIRDWAKSKGKTKRDAFAIRRWIMKHGTKKQPWVNDFVESVRMKKITQSVLERETRRVVA